MFKSLNIWLWTHAVTQTTCWETIIFRLYIEKSS